MVKRTINDLAVYTLDTEKKKLLFYDIRHLFLEKMTEIIYIVMNDRLYGIICLGDCLNRETEQYINVNTEYTKIINWNIMEAKNIFLKKSNINKIPVINDSYNLLGEYSRWDDDMTIKHFISRDVMKLLLERLGGKRRKYVIEEGKADIDFFNMAQVIDVSEVKVSLNQNSVYIFRNEDKKRALECYEGRSNSNFFTWSQLYREYTQSDNGELKSTLSALRQEGIKIFLLGNYNENYKIQEALKEEIVKRKNQKEGYWEDFLAELYTKSYSEAIASLKFIHKNVNGIRILQDTSSELLNVKDGIRKTYYLPERYVGTIWFFGPCIIAGAFVEDKNTIESFLQKELAEDGYEYRVVNCGAWEDVNRVLMNFTQFKKGDVIIVYTGSVRYKGFTNISLEDIYVKNNVSLKWAISHLHHCNHRVNELIAHDLFTRIKNDLCCGKSLEDQNYNMMYNLKSVRKKLIMETYINIYFPNFIKKENQKIGAIVMNCNPFTKGHQYLIKKAAEYVELLIVFVVQEDKSLFSFEERFEMVKEGVSDFSKVKVVPSGRYILSHTTFPEYFGKVKSEDLEIDIEYDLRLWGECIASVLGINYRFVGEEKEDMVTAAYNNAMKNLLPAYGISVIEVPRIRNHGKCISATYVRELLAKRKEKEAFSLVPLSTRRVIEKQL